MTLYFITKLSANSDKQPGFEITAQMWLLHRSFSLESALGRQHSSSLGQAAALQQQGAEKLPAHLPAPEINSAPGLDEPYLTQRLCETSLLASHCWPAWKTEVGSAECCTFFTNTGNSSQQAPTVISRAEPPPQPQDEQGERSQTGIYHFIPSGGA